MNRALFPIVASILLLPAAAAAMPTFPEQIQIHLGLAAAPGCVLCHASDVGGGAVSQQFGKAMVAAGLTTAGGDTLTGALDKLEAEGTDSNGDGIADIAALHDGMESTTSQPTANAPAQAQGCSIGPSSPQKGHLGWPWPLLMALMIGKLARRGRRRQRYLISSRKSHPITSLARGFDV